MKIFDMYKFWEEGLVSDVKKGRIEVWVISFIVLLGSLLMLGTAIPLWGLFGVNLALKLAIVGITLTVQTLIVMGSLSSWVMSVAAKFEISKASAKALKEIEDARKNLLATYDVGEINEDRLKDFLRREKQRNR